MKGNRGTFDPPCNASVTFSPVAQTPIILYVHFDVDVASKQYQLATLSVDFRCTDLKDYRIVCLHIQIIFM